MLRAVVVMPFLVGCGISWERYQEEKQEATCQMFIDCEYGALYGWETVDECLADPHAATTEEKCDGYDGGAAKNCLDGYLGLSCDKFTGGFEQVDACNEVCP